MAKQHFKKPKLIMACDTEDNSKGLTYMINFFDGNEHVTFTGKDLFHQAVDYLIALTENHRLEIWTANLGYDLGNVFRESSDSLSIKLAGSRFISAKVFLEAIEFKDILNIIPGASVKKLGKMINLEKMDSGGDFNNVEYCRRDTEIVYKAYFHFKEKLDEMGVEMKSTAASIAFGAMKGFLGDIVNNDFTSAEHDFMRSGYYGGRTEVFYTKKVKDNIWGYDVISMYPSIMRDLILPNVSGRYETKKPDLSKEGIISCTVRAPKIYLPYLPLKHREKNNEGYKLIFPVGEFSGVWSYFEIREALKLGYDLRRVERAIEFPFSHGLGLKKFVDTFFERRKIAKYEKDVVLDYACKIMLNSGYGKFCQGNEVTKLAARDEIKKIKGNFTATEYSNGQIFMKGLGPYMPFTNYLWGSLITAKSRHKLYMGLLKGCSDGRQLLYCDTDSVYFQGPEWQSEIGHNLGDFELKDTVSEAHFLLPKTYMLKTTDNQEVYRCKGVKNDLAKKFFTEGYAESMSPLKYIETCRKNLYRVKKNESALPFNLWVNKPKSMKAVYSKRKTLKNGDTEALKL